MPAKPTPSMRAAAISMLVRISPVAAMAVPLGMGIYFLELFVAFLQAYIFAMLSALYIGMGVAMGAHAEHPSEGTSPKAH